VDYINHPIKMPSPSPKPAIKPQPGSDRRQYTRRQLRLRGPARPACSNVNPKTRVAESPAEAGLSSAPTRPSP
jgi:hypothetical protein